MSRISQVEKFADRGLAPDLVLVEELRKQTLIKVAGLGFLYLAGAGALASYCQGKGSIAVMYGIWYALAGLFGSIYLYPWISAHYRREFKTRIIGRLVSWREANLGYAPDGHISEATFKRSRLHPGNNTTYKGEDLVMGTLGGTPLTFSELEVIRGSGKNSVTVFRGLFLDIETPATTQGCVVVMPDVAERIFGGLGLKLQAMTSARGGLVTFDDAVFEKTFVVYAEDEAAARSFLTAAMRKKLLTLNEKLGQELQFSFHPDRIYIGVRSSHNAFEPKLFSATTPADLVAYVESLEVAIRLVKELRPEGEQAAG